MLEKCNKGLFFIALTGFYVIIHEWLTHSEESSSDTQGSNDEQQEKKGARKGVFCRTQIPGLQYVSCTDVKINYFSWILGVAHHLEREIGQTCTVVEISEGGRLGQERKVEIDQTKAEQTGIW